MSEKKRVRGGSFYDQWNVRSASRGGFDPLNRYDNYGFRVVANGVQREPTHRVVRGGSFNFHRADARSAFLHSLTLYIRYVSYGFRVVTNRARGKEETR